MRALSKGCRRCTGIADYLCCSIPWVKSSILASELQGVDSAPPPARCRHTAPAARRLPPALPPPWPSPRAARRPPPALPPYGALRPRDAAARRPPPAPHGGSAPHTLPRPPARPPGSGGMEGGGGGVPPAQPARQLSFLGRRGGGYARTQRWARGPDHPSAAAATNHHRRPPLTDPGAPRHRCARNPTAPEKLLTIDQI
jgi:hypothetical protein